MKLKELKECTDQLPCKTVDCVWGLWSDWSTCSSPCDGGQRMRNRDIVQAPEKGGKPCEIVNKEEVEPCNMGKCNNEKCIDGKWDDWENWEPCSKTCDGGLTWRSRNILLEASDCGTPATGNSQEYASCNANVSCETDVDCMFSDWNAWSACSKNCDGIKKRSRRISLHGTGKGSHCKGSLKETVPCNPSESSPGCLRALTLQSECVLGDWVTWSKCSATCGGGQKKRVREVLKEAENGGACPAATLSETQGCRFAMCPDACMPVDCKWGVWGEWSACDKCGGQKRRVKHVLEHPQCGGDPCDAE